MALNRSPELRVQTQTQSSRAFWYLWPPFEQTQKSSTMQSTMPNFKHLSQVVLKQKIFFHIAYVFLCFKPRNPWRKAMLDPQTLI